MRWIGRISLMIAALLIWLGGTGLFLSKARLCNDALQKLSKESVGICYDHRQASLAGCRLKRVTLLYDHTPVAAVRSFALLPWRIEAQGIRLEGMLGNLLPPHIESVRFDPLTGILEARGDFGDMRGHVFYWDRKISLSLKPSALMKRRYRQILGEFRYINGSYRYETRF